MPAECGNPLLLEWLKEWFDEARQRNSKGATTYKKAYDSMKACPLAFKHPLEAQVLNGLGPKLCDRLTEKLKAHCAENGLPMPRPSHKVNKRQSGESLAEEPGPSKRPQKTRPYVPSLRSGAYALIVALSSISEDSSNGLSKSQTIELAQPYCDSSFTAPSDPTKFYTAWSSMKTLLAKDLVYERGRPSRKYALTEDGWEVAKRIQRTGEIPQAYTQPTEKSRSEPLIGFSSSEIMDLGEEPEGSRLGASRIDSSYSLGNRSRLPESHVKASARSGSGCCPLPQSTKVAKESGNLVATATHLTRENAFSTSFEPIEVPCGTFTVQLVLDTREVRAKTDRDYIQDELAKKGVPPIVRPLELGDALWVAKLKDPSFLSRRGEEGDEIMLDWIVERKRLDDLIGSIVDGRFHEQKFRLRKSGVKNVVYIIEEISMSQEHSAKYHDAVETAIASTQVVNGYFVKKTQKLDDTIRYLARMTMMLKSLYESKPLILIPTASLTPQTYLPLLTHLRSTQPLQPFNITFPSFSSLASKSDSLTLRDVFLKMLMCTRGITGDKALEIQKRWRTPRAFIEAYEQLGDGGEGEAVGRMRREMVWSVAGELVGRKKVGKALSTKVMEVWGEG